MASRPRRPLVTLLVALWCAAAASAFAEPPVDLNLADATTLSTLPGIGPEKAAAIIAWRVRNGRFTQLTQLTEVPGVGPATLASARTQLTISASTAEPAANDATGSFGLLSRPAVDINHATAAELATLPGISRVRATDLVTDRERNGPFERCADLTRVVGVGPATVAAIGPLCVTR